MNGLKTRLESIEGVAGIELELGDQRLEGITVRLTEDADEVKVLEGIRRLLIAYGTKPSRSPMPAGVDNGPSRPGPGHPSRPHVAARVPDGEGPAAETAEEPPVRLVSSGPDRAEMYIPDGDRLQLSVTPAGDRSTAQVVYSTSERTLSRQVPGSARAIVQAVLDMAAEMSGREPISVIGLNLSTIEGMRVLTVIAGNEGETPRVSTVSVLGSNWPAALLEIASQILEDRSG